MRKRPPRYFIEPVDEVLQCKVCQDIFYDPHIINCGHSFCYLCISLIRTAQKTCIECHKSIEPIQLIPNINLSAIIDDLQTMCAFEGCNWTGSCSDLKAHRRLCKFRPIKVYEPIDPESVIDLEGPKTWYNEGFNQKTNHKKEKQLNQELIQCYPLLDISEGQSLRLKPSIMPYSYPATVSLPFFNYEQVSMVDESESIWDSNRSSNQIDQPIQEEQIFLLAESSDFYQTEKQQTKKAFIKKNSDKHLKGPEGFYDTLNQRANSHD